MDDLQVFDGVGVALKGDTIVSLWLEPATLSRVRWHRAVVESFFARVEQPLVLMIIHETSSPPKGEARDESNALAGKLARRVRAMVTVASGNGLWEQVVRSMMRAMFLMSGQSKRLSVVASEAEGIARITRESGGSTPSASEIAAVIEGLRVGLQSD
ncbi:MAG: hypothetical protein QM756_36060 [Polyangiaceae bacterium]